MSDTDFRRLEESHYQNAVEERQPWVARLLRSDRPALNLLLLLLTFLSTFHYGYSALSPNNSIADGLWYSGGIISILLCHEMGHYLMCLRHGVRATLPFFIPFPVFSPFGTLGAVIRMDSRLPDRRALFDIGVAGPLAGLAVAVPAIFFGLKMSAITDVTGSMMTLGESLLFKWLSFLAKTEAVPAGKDIVLHPLAYAGWAGLFVTALNLLPIGQLYKDAKFNEEKVYYADASILNLFSFKLLEGDKQQALTQPHTIVMTSSFAKKYFGEEPAMGKSLIMNGEEAFLVTGILEDLPKNSHLQFDFLLSFETLKSQEFMLGWADFLTYVLLKPGVNAEQLNAKLISSNLVAKLLGRESTVQLTLQPLYDIHLHSHMEGEAEVNGSAMITYGLLIVAFLILVIAWMNYVNLATARALDRAKEVGIRKTVGAERGDLVRQFLMESVILNGAAVLAALLFVAELLPLFNRVFGASLTFSTYGRFKLWGLLLVFFVVGSLTSSLYPAFVMSSFQPIKTLKGQFQLVSGKLTLRKALVVYQFATSIVLIAGTWAVFRQLAFMRHQELGVNIEQTLIVKAPSIADSTYSVRLNSFKSELLRHEAIQSLTSSTNIPGRESTWGGSVRRYGEVPQNAVGVDYTGIDYDFVAAYGMKLLAGRNFSKDFSSDQSAALVNEAALRLLRYDKPEEIIGQKIIGWRGAEVQVVGVLQTHHQLALQHAQLPTVFFLRSAGGDFYSIKFKTADIAGTIDRIKAEYEKLFSGNPFDYFFLDEYFNRQYQADQRFGQIFGLFAGLAIVIAGLGLFALSAFAAVKRTKEIGIRKVLGATTPNLVMLLSKDFLLLLSLANLVALPLAGIIVKKWLENYAFHIDLGWDMFVIPAFIVAAIALMTVSARAIKAALANPVEALRYE